MLAVLGTSADGASVLADRIASELPMEIAEKQALLEILDPVQRLEKILARLSS
jgi:Lon protease-like protein